MKLLFPKIQCIPFFKEVFHDLWCQKLFVSQLILNPCTCQIQNFCLFCQLIMLNKSLLKMIFKTLIDIYIKFYSSENFGLIMNNFFYNFWDKWQKWNGARRFERLIEILHSFDIGKAKTSAPSFKNLLDKLSIPAAFSGLVSVNNFKISSSEVGKKVNFWFPVFRNLL